ELANHYQPSNTMVQKFRALLTEIKAKRPQLSSVEVSSAAAQSTNDQLKSLAYQGQANATSSATAAGPSLLPDPKDKIEEQNLLHPAMMASDDNRSDEARQALENS